MRNESDDSGSKENAPVPQYVMDFKWKRKARFYKMKWMEEEEEDTWEDAEDIEPMFPNLVEDFWARIDTSIEKESSGAETAEDLDYDPTLARSPNSDYNSVEDADFRQPTSSSSSSSSEEGDAASVESNDDRWLSVRSIEGMDKTIDGSQRVYIRWLDGRKTIHPLSVVRRKCTEMLLDYYEQNTTIAGLTVTN